MQNIFSQSYLNPDGAPEITPENLKEKLGQVQVIDVRRPDEYNGEYGHIEGAPLVTLESKLEDELNKLDKQKTYVFVCRSGGRSSKATLLAQSKGFQSVFNMKGGMMRWTALEFPVVRS